MTAGRDTGTVRHHPDAVAADVVAGMGRGSAVVLVAGGCCGSVFAVLRAAPGAAVAAAAGLTATRRTPPGVNPGGPRC